MERPKFTREFKLEAVRLTEQTKELAALAQKVTLATAEPLKMGMQQPPTPSN